MQKMRIKFKHLGIVARSRTLKNLVLKSWNLAWCHVMVVPCRGKKYWPNRNKFWYKLLANRSFSQEGSWFREGTCHLRVRNEIRTLPSPALIFLHRQIRSNRGIVLKIWIILGLFGIFLYINWISGHLMCIIQIWTTSTCSSAPKLVEKSHVCPWMNF